MYFKRKNLFLLEQILSFKRSPQFGRAMLAREVNRKSRKLFPLVKLTGNLEVCPYTLTKSAYDWYPISLYKIWPRGYKTIVVGILTLISRKKIHTQMSWAWKKFYNLVAWFLYYRRCTLLCLVIAFLPFYFGVFVGLLFCDYYFSWKSSITFSSGTLYT